MYQALYGDTFDIGLEKSLLDCVKEALRNIETTPLGVSKDTPIEISQSSAGRNSWEKAMKVSGIKTIVKKWLDKPSGNGYFRVNSCKGQVGRTRISNFKEPEEKKEVVTKKPEEATKKPEKDSTTEKKSWSEILRRESYVEVL